MRRLLPAFVQRRMLLSAARRALSAGRPEAALELLRDDLLVEDARATSLRALILPLIPTPPAPPPPQAGSASFQGREQMRGLLAEMRAKRGGPAEPAGTPADGEAPSATAAANSPAAPGLPAGRAARLRLSIDDAGTFLVCAGVRALVGHSRAGEADVPILADLLPRHARFVLEPPSFHGGSRWRVEPVGAAQVQVSGRVLGPEGLVLRPGDRMHLGSHLRVRFEQPDRASDSCTLELDSGVEAAGARRILLFAPGPAGRMRIGAGATHHVQAALGGAELELVHDAGKLTVRCATGLVPDEAQASDPRTEVELPLNLLRPVHLRLCMAHPAERPRWVSFAALEEA